jgi:hypothetical protein
MPDHADEILALELSLLSRSVRTSRAQLERLLTDDFVEFGSSGAVYSKPAVIDRLVTDPELSRQAPSVSDFRARVLAPNVVLVTYRCAESMRSSIWRKEASSWAMVFHQGTPSRRRLDADEGTFR